jgi:hypothetical protein
VRAEVTPGRYPRWLRPGLLAAALLLPAGTDAQVPDTIPVPPPDTVPARPPVDPLQIPIPPEQLVRDTLPPADTARAAAVDTLAVPPHLRRYPQPELIGFGMARWEWDRAGLQRYHGLSLLELLERVPGLTVVRAGGFGSPAGVSYAGQGGGRLRVFRDGFELDPLGAAVYDLQYLGLLDLENLRVERTPAEVRVHLRTFQLEDRRPFSEIEIGTGNFQARFLRAILSRVVANRSVVTATYDLASAGGFRFDEPFTFSSGRLRWDVLLAERAGLQFEFRQAGSTLESPVFPVDFDRRELVARGRAELAPGLTVEGVLGTASHRPRPVERDTLGAIAGPLPTSVDTLALASDARQGMLRALYQLGFGFAEAGVRGRQVDTLGFAGPTRELFLRAGAHPLPWLGGEAELRQTGEESGSATEMRAGVRASGFLGLSAFATLTAGERWVSLRRDTAYTMADTVLVEGVPAVTQRTVREARFPRVAADLGGSRVGVEWSGWGSRAGIASVTSAGSELVPFGLRFDRAAPPVVALPARGVEGYGVLAAPGRFQGLRLEGWYTQWYERGGRPYLPAVQATAALVYHDLRRAGQFEPHLRVEAVHRGEMFVPDAAQNAFVVAEPHTQLNLRLQLRILDVRAFLVYENILQEVEAADLPGRWLPPARTLYGVRWFFRN